MDRKQTRIFELLEQAKKIAAEYYQLTGKPLGITGEIGEYLAAYHLKLTLAGARTAGYDAVDSNNRKLQIKSRSIPTGKTISGQRIGSIRLEHEWDSVIIVLMNEKFEALEMHEASRKEITKALLEPGSKARNERGALSVSKFRNIGKKVWP